MQTLPVSKRITLKNILFATDFSPASNVAFEVASALARDYRARMIAVHVIEPMKMGFSEFASYVGPEEDREEAREKLNAIKAPSPRVTRTLVTSKAVRTVVWL